MRLRKSDLGPKKHKDPSMKETAKHPFKKYIIYNMR
jgi:hypothetical protein